VDLGLLPADLRAAARVDPNGEVAWPVAFAHDAIVALARAGFVVLGLDVRTYGADGSIMEVAWSSFGGTVSIDSITEARDEALDALGRPDLPGDWVLVTVSA